MAEISKQALKVANNTEFPNNNAGAITPSRLRTFNVDMIDSLVDEISYTADSGSWNQQINALEQFTASASGLSTGSLLVTASAASNVITFTKGNGSTFNVTVADTTDLSSLNTFTASAAISISNLNQSSASQQTQINSLIAATASYATSAITASSLITASFNNGTRNLTFTKGDASTFSVNIPDVSGSSGNFVTTSSFNAYTASNDQRVSSLEANSASVNTSITNVNSATASLFTSVNNINTFTQSAAISINALNAATSSYAISSSVAAVDAAQQAQINALIAFTGSVTASINTGSFATTGSNNFVGNQIISGGLAVSSSQAISFTGSTFVVNTQDGPGGPIVFRPGTSIQFLGNTDFSNPGRFPLLNVDASGSGYYGFNNEVVGRIYQDFSGSVDSRINAITPTATGSLLVTASAAGADITFTKGDGSTFSVTVATGSVASASYAETASLAINALDIVVTAKNTTGAQLNKGTVVRIIGATGDNPLIGTASWTDDTTSANTLGFVVANIPNDGFGRVMTQGTLLSVNTDPTLGYTAGQLIYLSGSGQYTNVKPPAPYHEVRLGQVLRAQSNNGSIYVLVQNGYELSELHDVDINTGSLANNDLLAYDSASQQWENKTFNELGLATTGSNTFRESQTITTGGNTDLTLISTLSNGQTNILLNAFQNNIASTGNFSFNNYGQFGGSGSVRFISSLNSIDFAADAGTKVGPTNGSGNGINSQAISLQSHSGSLSLAPSGFNNTTASLSHISSSSGTNFVNLMFKSNNNTAGVIVSGSNNIFVNPGAATAGFVRYIGGNNNIYTNVLPQITGSAAFPIIMTNNISNSGVLFRAPVSSSTYTISGNLLMNASGTGLNFGASAANNFERAVSGLTISNNLIAGGINATAAKTPLSASTTISSNNIGGTVTLNYDSSSINFNGTTVQGGLTVNNSYFPSTINTNSLLGIGANLYIGVNSIYASGSNATFTAGRSVGNTAMIGNGNVISASLNGDNTNVNSTILLGQALTVVGTNARQAANTMPDYGSVFVGRWNDINGTKDQTAETVFAVGTGTAEGSRKTGLLIDSGSNTFVEGSLNVSGSASFTGSVAGNVVALSITSNTASMDLNTANYFTLTLADTATTHITATNIKPGTSATLVITTGTNSSASLAPILLEPSGSDYVATNGSAKKDVLSFVSVDSTNLFVVSTKNMI